MASTVVPSSFGSSSSSAPAGARTFSASLPLLLGVVTGGAAVASTTEEVRRCGTRIRGARLRRPSFVSLLAVMAYSVMATSVVRTTTGLRLLPRRPPSTRMCFVSGGGRIRGGMGASLTRQVSLPPPLYPVVTGAFRGKDVNNGVLGDGRRLLSTSLSGGGGGSSEDEELHHRLPNRPKSTVIVPVDYDEEVERAMTLSGYKRPAVNWYPGHIAKAERMLAETLRSVDVVIEVRDARAPKATAHPRVGEWTAGRPRIVVLTKVDTVPTPSRVQWKRSYDSYGAGNWDSDVDGNVRNQARQALSERRKYDSEGGSGKEDDGGERAAVSDVEDVLFVDARRGQGVHSIHRAVLRAGSHVNERRRRRGLSERPLRVGVIGYPNVGKSALINRILGRRRAKSANTPGITRTLQWIRVRGDKSGTGTSGSGRSSSKKTDFELLDSPGIIPANIADQSDALLLAACNSIGTGAYDNQGVASYLCEWIKTLHLMGKGEITSPQWRDKCRERYGFDPMLPRKVHDGEEERLMTGEDMLYTVADNTCRGDPEDAARKILQDFRSGRMGPISLQLAPESSSGDGQQRVRVKRGVAAFSGVTEEQWLSKEARLEREREERERRSAAAMETAKQKGLELPPIVSSDDSSSTSDEVGKGQFDGW